MEKLRQETALAAASVPPPQLAHINVLGDWHCRPEPTKVRVAAAVVSREAIKEVLAQRCGFAGSARNALPSAGEQENIEDVHHPIRGRGVSCVRRAAMCAWRQPRPGRLHASRCGSLSIPARTGSNSKEKRLAPSHASIPHGGATGQECVRRLGGPDNDGQLEAARASRREEPKYECSLFTLASFGGPRAVIEAVLEASGKQ